MAQLDDLKQQLTDMDGRVESLTGHEASMIALLQELKAAVDKIPQAVDLSEAIAMAQAISTKIETDDQAMVDAVVANTPNAPTP